MNVTYLDGETRKFFKMAEDLNLIKLFDVEKREYNPERVDNFLAVASSGERVTAQFLLSVWRHDNEFGFDIIEAARTLDDKHLKIIAEWIADPFWP